MKTLVFTISFLLFAICFHQQANAQQNYNTALGLRFGPNYGITLKHFFKSPWAFEGILSTRGWNNGRNGRGVGGFNFTGLAEWHGVLPNAKGFAWYAGLGAHLGRWYGSGWGGRQDDRYYYILGVDAIIGLEYTFPTAPFNVSIDYKPEFDLVGGSHFWGDGIAVSLRIKLK
jgi:hypothetical protein